MTKFKPTDSHFTPHTNSERASATELKSASEKVPISAHLLKTSHILFLVIIMCLAEKGILSPSQPAQLLEGMRDAMPDDATRPWLTEIITGLWNFDKKYDGHTINKK
jgi:hypothetical protein